jgi:hypothetical protein
MLLGVKSVVKRSVARSSALLLALALALTACPEPPPPPPDLDALTSAPLGTVTLSWDTAKRSAETDSSGAVRFEPLTYSDLDDTAGGFRYLTATFRVTNLGTSDLQNLSLRAVARAGNLGGTAISDLRAFPDPQNPGGVAITDPSVAQSFIPLHGTQLGPSQPQPDPLGSDFQMYRATESAALQTSARQAGFITDADTVLDYGFVTRSSVLQPQTSPPPPPAVYGRLLPAGGGSGTLSVAVRLPRRFQNSPRPYTFNWQFLVTTDSAPRASRALLETTAAAVTRAKALSPQAQLALTGADDAPADLTGVRAFRLEGVRIGTATTLP